jgi:hypothetical protein
MGKREGCRVKSEEHGPVETAQPAARQMYESLTRTRSGPDVSPWQGGKDPRQRVGGSAGKPVPAASTTAGIQWPATKKAVRKCSVHFFTASFLLSNLFYFVDPAFRTFDFAHLDASQGLVQLGQHRAHFFHPAGDADFLAVVHNLAHRANDGSGAA